MGMDSDEVPFSNQTDDTLGNDGDSSTDETLTGDAEAIQAWLSPIVSTCPSL